MDDSLPLTRERVGLVVGEPFRMRQSQRDLAITFDVPKILRGGDERHVKRPSLGRLPYLDELELVTGGIELLKIGNRVVIGGEMKIRPDGEAQRRFRGRYRLPGNDGRREQQQEERSHLQSFRKAGILSDRPRAQAVFFEGIKPPSAKPMSPATPPMIILTTIPNARTPKASPNATSRSSPTIAIGSLKWVEAPSK